MSNDPKDIDYDYDAAMLERDMTGQPEPRPLLEMNKELVRQMQARFCEVADEMIETLPDVVYLEVQTALIATFATHAFDALSQCDYDLFAPNRNETLRLLYIVAEQIHQLRPSEMQLASVPVAKILH